MGRGDGSSEQPSAQNDPVLITEAVTTAANGRSHPGGGKRSRALQLRLTERRAMEPAHGGEANVSDLLPPPTGAAVLSALTSREREVLRRLAAGASNKEMGRSLGISIHTVERHVANIYLKLGCHNRAGATALALRWSEPAGS